MPPPPHTPPEQLWTGHTVPHWPQLSASVCRLTQALPPNSLVHTVCPGRHELEPPDEVLEAPLPDALPDALPDRAVRVPDVAAPPCACVVPPCPPLGTFCTPAVACQSPRSPLC